MGWRGGGLKILIGQTMYNYISVIISILIGLDSHMKKANKSFILLGMKYHSPSFPESLWVIFLFKRKNLLGEDYRNLLFNGMQKITTNVFTCLSENPVASNQLIWYSNTLMTEGYNKQV